MKNPIYTLLLCLVPFLCSAQYIDGGYQHTIMLCEDSTVATFGQNNSYQLGIGTQDFGQHPNPEIPIGIPQKVTQVAANDYASYVLLKDSTVMAWGQGAYGQIGHGSSPSFVANPTPVSNLDSVIQIEGGTEGDFAVALRADGTIWAWGDNSSGQLGIGNYTNQNTPQQVVGLTDVIDVAPGANHCMALKSDGTVWVWGGNFYGQLGQPLTIGDTTLPILVDTILAATNVEAGLAFSMAIDADSTVWAFGINFDGQLGINSTATYRYQPTKVHQLDSIIDITCGREHTIAIKWNGKTWAWGEGGYNQLGINTLDRIAPYPTNAVVPFVSINAGNWCSYGTDISGNLYCFGRNTYGQLGNGSINGSGSIIFPNPNGALCDITAPVVMPVANFTADSTGNMMFDFTDFSMWADSWFWDFGDGSPIDSTQNPQHTFPAPGTYTVCLIAANQFGTDTFCTSVVVSCLPPSSSYTWTASTLYADFTESSTDATNWFWDFGDGNTSTSQNPSHTYPSAGTYTACLVAINNCNTDTFCQQITITCPLPAASWAYNTNLLDVSFTSLSVNADSVLWDFGDGNSSTQTNPNHTYATPGTYVFCITAFNDCGSDSTCQSITVDCPLPLSSFFANENNLEVTFTSFSSNSNSAFWDFGDGNTSTQTNPVHTYAAPGTYNVCLTDQNTCGSDFTCQNVTVVCPLPQSSFTSTTVSLTAQFTPTATNTTSYLWDFGDGNTSTQIAPTHNYTASGVYQGCLTATSQCGSDVFCDSITVIGVGVEEIGASNSIALFPNPTDGEITLQLPESTPINTIRIYSVHGKLIKELPGISGKQQSVQLSLEGYPAGTYIIHVLTNDDTFVSRLVLE